MRDVCHTANAWCSLRLASAPRPVRSVYVAAELHMLTDFSPGYQDTWQVCVWLL